MLMKWIVHNTPPISFERKEDCRVFQNVICKRLYVFFYLDELQYKSTWGEVGFTESNKSFSYCVSFQRIGILIALQN